MVSFSGEDQVDLSDQVVCLDPVYEVLWGWVILHEVSVVFISVVVSNA